uniref:Uncharacterized protein n=1 Tax=Meloidogyne enterolobii TaxID=390850 RepID=A0A6V7WGR9_MELEN|nr:unnamed protein product [Meloidogyne enterolobii]
MFSGKSGKCFPENGFRKMVSENLYYSGSHFPEFSVSYFSRISGNHFPEKFLHLFSEQLHVQKNVPNLFLIYSSTN